MSRVVPPRREDTAWGPPDADVQRRQVDYALRERGYHRGLTGREPLRDEPIYLAGYRQGLKHKEGAA